jgi:asparagine synthase (glutamine-hydrolysing)
MVAERYGTDHHEFVVRPQAVDILPKLAWHYDEPFADSSAIPTYCLAQLTRQHVTVALNGDGGDENFAGYERYLGFRLSGLTERFPLRQLSLAARPLVRSIREQKGGHYRINHLKRFLDAVDLPPSYRWQRYHAAFSQPERRALFQPAIAREIDFDAVDAAGRVHFERCEAADPLDRALYQDLMMYLPDDILALTDRVGMWHSLELRVPFVDHTLVEFCARIPAHYKLRRGQKKHLLREAARPFLPDDVLDHRKQGFASPMAMWLRGPMKTFAESSLSPAVINSAGILVPAEVTTRLEEHQSRRRLNDKQIFSLLMFQRWWTRRPGG